MPRKRRPTAPRQPQLSLRYDDVWPEQDPADAQLFAAVQLARRAAGMPAMKTYDPPTREEWEALTHAERVRIARERDQADHQLAKRIRAERKTA